MRLPSVRRVDDRSTKGSLRSATGLTPGFRPESKLETLDDQLAGLHSLGPRWQANNGSEVKGTKPPIQNWKSPDPKSAAWLLLEVSASCKDRKNWWGEAPKSLAIPARIMRMEP